MRRAWLLAVALIGMAGAVPAAARSEVFFAKMSPDQTVPPSSSNTRAEIALQVDDEKNVVCYLFKWDGEDEPTALHLHRGEPGSEGPVMIDLGVPDYNKSGCTSSDHAIVSYVNDVPASHYVDLHTTNFPNGSARGQLAPSEGRSTPRTSPSQTTEPPPPPPQPGAPTTVSTSNPPASSRAPAPTPETVPPPAPKAPAVQAQESATAPAPPPRTAAAAPAPGAAPVAGGGTAAAVGPTDVTATPAARPAGETAGSASAAAAPPPAPAPDETLALAERSTAGGSKSSAGIAAAAVAAAVVMAGAAAYGIRRRSA